MALTSTDRMLFLLSKTGRERVPRVDLYRAIKRTPYLDCLKFLSQLMAAAST